MKHVLQYLLAQELFFMNDTVSFIHEQIIFVTYELPCVDVTRLFNTDFMLKLKCDKYND